MKRDKIIRIIFAIVVVICVILYMLPSKATEDELKFKKEYEIINNKINTKTSKKNRKVSIPEKNGIQYLTAKEMIEKINNRDTFIVYFGFSDCPWCRSIIETLISTMKDNGIKELYYVDIKEIRDQYVVKNSYLIKEKEGTKAYERLIKKIGNVLKDYNVTDENGQEVSTGKKRIYAPNVVGIKEGKAIIMETGISDKQTDSYMKLTSKMKNDTKKQIENVINKIYE